MFEQIQKNYANFLGIVNEKFLSNFLFFLNYARTLFYRSLLTFRIALTINRQNIYLTYSLTIFLELLGQY